MQDPTAPLWLFVLVGGALIMAAGFAWGTVRYRTWRRRAQRIRYPTD